MTKTGHTLTGLALAALVLGLPPAWIPHPWLAAAGILIGSNAPDWMEIAWFNKTTKRRQSVIEHRTWTHWVLAWWIGIGVAWWATTSWSDAWLFVGFAIGGWLHLLMDWCNPTGVPLLTPFKSSRVSLHLWVTGSLMEIPVILVFAAAAFETHRRYGWFHDIENHPGLSAVRTVVERAFLSLS